MGDGVNALSEDVCAHAGLIVQQRALVWIGGRGVHARAEIHVHPLVPLLALDDGGRSVGAEAGGVDEVALREDADGRSPLDRGQALVEGTSGRIVVRDEPRRLAGAEEEMRQGVGAIFKSAGLARRCGNRISESLTCYAMPRPAALRDRR